ncbi:MAG TPA: asparagine synthase-related protein [Gammaproteobacteria bacterium]|nr:asparagine synthase-related protein [Gammaproteobacteria bacterium]
MVAIYGVLGDASRSELEAMGARLAHRGNFGAQWSPAPGVWLGMQSRQFADLATDGPLLFDGSLDNRWQLGTRRGAGTPPACDPSTDASMLLELLETEGPRALELLAGSFAIAWWRAQDRTLLLARDRIGYGPLHFTVDRAGRFVFASEYKALLALETVDAQPNRDAIQVLQNTKWTKPGETCLAGIYPVAPGTALEVDAGALSMQRYWNIPVAVKHDDDERHAAELREVFLDTLQSQTRAYRRIGVSMSGGLDSAVVAAGARHVVGNKPLHTFTAGYGPDDREIINAARVAETLKTEHHEIILRPEDLPKLLPEMVWHLEEPIGREDIAYLFVAARQAARHVDVILAGFGFDGLFAGLPRHRLVDLANKVPLARAPLEQFYDFTFRSVEPRTPAGRALRYAYFRGSDYPAPRVLGARPLAKFTGFPRAMPQPLTSFLRRNLLLNPYQVAIEHLYSAVGVRMNAQHTNPKFIAAAFSIPDRLKIRGTTQKYILRKACAGLLPAQTLGVGKSFNRMKHDLELCESLDAMADTLLSRSDVAARGLFDPGYIAELRKRPAGQPYGRERIYRLWTLLLTELWSREFLDGRGAPRPATVAAPRHDRVAQHAVSHLAPTGTAHG